jgi:hydrogenase/urease accessory protein HupE
MRFAGLILLAAAAPALAHPGQHAAAELLHLLTEPDHLAAILLPLVIGLVLLLRRYFRPR